MAAVPGVNFSHLYLSLALRPDRLDPACRRGVRPVVAPVGWTKAPDADTGEGLDRLDVLERNSPLAPHGYRGNGDVEGLTDRSERPGFRHDFGVDAFVHRRILTVVVNDCNTKLYRSCQEGV